MKSQHRLRDFPMSLERFENKRPATKRIALALESVTFLHTDVHIHILYNVISSGFESDWLLCLPAQGRLSICALVVGILQ